MEKFPRIAYLIQILQENYTHVDIENVCICIKKEYSQNDLQYLDEELGFMSDYEFDKMIYEEDFYLANASDVLKKLYNDIKRQCFMYHSDF